MNRRSLFHLIFTTGLVLASLSHATVYNVGPTQTYHTFNSVSLTYS